MKRLYLLLAIVGAVVPYIFFVQRFINEGLSLVRFVTALFGNPATGAFASDLLITWFILRIVVIYERRRNQAPSRRLFVPRDLLIGLPCGFRPYLCAREAETECSSRRQQVTDDD